MERKCKLSKKELDSIMEQLLQEEYEEEIFSSLYLLQHVEEDYPKAERYSDSAIMEECPFLTKDYLMRDTKHICETVVEAIAEQLEKEHTYVQTARLVRALYAMEYKKQSIDEMLKQQKKKVEFCVTLFGNQECLEDISTVLKAMKVLD